MGNYGVYRHIRLDTNVPFYIGKGLNKRAFSKRDRNQYWHNIVNKYGYEVEIMLEGLTNENAIIKEKEFIKLINNQKQVEKERLEKEKAKEKMIERQEILKREEEELLLRNRFLESLKTSKEFFEAYKTGNEIEINKVKEKLFEEFVKK